MRLIELNYIYVFNTIKQESLPIREYGNIYINNISREDLENISLYYIRSKLDNLLDENLKFPFKIESLLAKSKDDVLSEIGSIEYSHLLDIKDFKLNISETLFKNDRLFVTRFSETINKVNSVSKSINRLNMQKETSKKKNTQKKIDSRINKIIF